MSTDEHTITDTLRLEAMFHNGWSIRQRNRLFCIPGVTKWKPSARAAIDAAMAIDTGNALAEVSASTTPSWEQWEIRVFPATASKADIRRIGREHGWIVSVRKIRKTGEWHAMATDAV